MGGGDLGGEGAVGEALQGAHRPVADDQARVVVDQDPPLARRAGLDGLRYTEARRIAFEGHGLDQHAVLGGGDVRLSPRPERLRTDQQLVAGPGFSLGRGGKRCFCRHGAARNRPWTRGSIESRSWTGRSGSCCFWNRCTAAGPSGWRRTWRAATIRRSPTSASP